MECAGIDEGGTQEDLRGFADEVRGSHVVRLLGVTLELNVYGYGVD